MSVDTTTSLEHAVDEAFEVPCESVIHAWLGVSAGSAFMYGFQPSVKPCGCKGLVIAHCEACMAYRLTQTRWGICVRCRQPDDCRYVRWEPIR